MYIMSGVTDKKYAMFVISATNYPLFYQNKDVEKYLQFFKREYLKQKKQ
jgi:hypothetical protein